MSELTNAEQAFINQVSGDDFQTAADTMLGGRRMPDDRGHGLHYIGRVQQRGY